MPVISAEYRSETSVNKLFMESATYTIQANGENNIKYAVDTTLTSYDDSSGTLLSGSVQITPSSYISFVSDNGYMILEISTEDTGVVFGTVQTKEEKQDEDISLNSQKMETITDFIQYKTEDVSLNLYSPEKFWKYIDGFLVEASGLTRFNAVDPIEVTPGDKYIISGEVDSQANLVVILDDNGDVVYAYPNESATAQELLNHDFAIPSDGVSMLVNNINLGATLQKITGFENRKLKIGIVGDSLSDRESNYTVYQWDNWLEEIDGFEINNVAVGGTGYRSGYGTSQSFYQQAQTLDSDCDIVIMFGSFNDMNEIENSWPIGTIGDNSNTSIYGNIKVAYDQIVNTCPDAKTIIASPTPWPSVLPTIDKTSDEYLYFLALQESAEYYGLNFVDLFRTTSTRPTDSDFKIKYYNKSGGVHFNGLGHKKYIYKPMREAIYSLL